MARSLLEKHSKKPITRSNQNDLKVIEGGNKRNSQERLTDADWYHIHEFWKSSLFNRHYLRDDFQKSRSKELAEYESSFQTFLTQFLNLCDAKRDEKFNTWNEDQTVRSWIMPVMETLGWWDSITDPVIPELTFTVNDGGKKKTLRPDCVFVPKQKLKGVIQEKEPSERIDLARRYVILTLEAKYWDRIRKFDTEDDEIGAKVDSARSRKDDSASSLSPGGQILTYLRHLRNDDPPRNHFGIVTDGKIWRLYHADRPEAQFYEFDLGELFFECTAGKAITDLTGKQYQLIEEAARYFYYVFSKRALYSDAGEPTLVDDMLAHRKKYVESAEENLKIRFLTAMKYTCNGFSRAFKEAGLNHDLTTIRDVSESYIFNILFLKSCEANGIIRREANTDISITSIIERIAYFDPSDSVDDETNESLNLRPKFKEFSYRNVGTELHHKILKLTNFVQTGGKFEDGSDFFGFKETLYSDSEKACFTKCHLNNIETVKILFELGYMEEDGKSKQIPYNIFTPEQLGSIYESFLEFTLSKADEDLEYVNKQWKPISKTTLDKLKRRETVKLPLARKGELFFTPDNKERKASGSYYTPDHVVKCIVEDTLAPLCSRKSSAEILNLRVCDPAMGSGHFLTGALRFLTERYLDALGSEPAAKYKSPPQAKRDILDSCIFGVDKNPRAVRLAKMALWLETAQSGRKLERLVDQLKCGDAVNNSAFSWSKEFPRILDNGNLGFDAIVMNPPYLGIKDNSHLIGYLRNLPEWKHIVTNKYDLFYFFIARAIEILRPSGRLGCITTSYWPTADGAGKLRLFLTHNAVPEQFIFFDEIKLFSEAKGQHNLISLFTKSSTKTGKIIISELKPLSSKLKVESLEEKDLLRLKSKGLLAYNQFESSLDIPTFREMGTTVWNLNIRDGGNSDKILSKMSSLDSRLMDFFNIHSGIETGADRITPKHLEPKGETLDRSLKAYKEDIKKSGVKKGDGIFVLSSEEVENLALTKSELNKYIKPFIKNGDIKTPFALNKKTFDQFLIYFENGKLEKGSKIFNHLARFKPVLENRYKYRTEDRLEWFDLHRPLNAEVISSKKLISPYRAVKPVFAYMDGQTYSSIDVFFTLPLKTDSNLFLALGLLNSKLVWYWLRHKGKVKGRILELYSKPLGDIPFCNYYFKENDVRKTTVAEAKKYLRGAGGNQKESARLISGLAIHLMDQPDDADALSIIDQLALDYYGIESSMLAFIEDELNQADAEELPEEDVA